MARWFLILSASLLFASSATAYYPGSYNGGWYWPNVHWPSLAYNMTYSEGRGIYHVYYPGGMGSSYTASPLIRDKVATTSLIEVVVPTPNAEVFVNGVKIAGTGPSRLLRSPQLWEGERYFYEIKVRWIKEKGARPIDEIRFIRFEGGSSALADFTKPEME